VETLGSRQVYAGPWMSVREDTVRLPDGSTGVYGVVEAADIALVVPVEGDRLHLVEQDRHPVAGRRWEFPSGSLDDRLDIDPEAAASRELREETGLEAGSVTSLGVLDITPSTFSQRCTVFLATDLTQGVPMRDPQEQDMRSAWVPRAEVERMITDGTITDSKTVAAYALLLVRAGR
jgi:8-oxo-dGDP phosphatase